MSPDISKSKNIFLNLFIKSVFLDYIIYSITF
nr:MAG TPA: hypothetical protein [Bacteriophage sp.]